MSNQSDNPESLKDKVLAWIIIIPLALLVLWVFEKYDINVKRHPWESLKILAGLAWIIAKWFFGIAFAVWIAVAVFLGIKSWIEDRPELRQHRVFRGFFRLTCIISALPILSVWLYAVFNSDEMHWFDRTMGMGLGLGIGAIPWILFAVAVFIADGFRDKKPNP